MVKGKIVDVNNPKKAVVQLEQVFTVTELDTRLFNVPNLQMLGQWNIRATLSASDMDNSSGSVMAGGSTSGRIVDYQCDDNIYGTCVFFCDWTFCIVCRVVFFKTCC